MKIVIIISFDSSVAVRSLWLFDESIFLQFKNAFSTQTAAKSYWYIFSVCVLCVHQWYECTWKIWNWIDNKCCVLCQCWSCPAAIPRLMKYNNWHDISISLRRQFGCIITSVLTALPSDAVISHIACISSSSRCHWRIILINANDKFCESTCWNSISTNFSFIRFPLMANDNNHPLGKGTGTHRFDNIAFNFGSNAFCDFIQLSKFCFNLLIRYFFDHDGELESEQS